MRLYGRAVRGQRLVDRIPHGHWKISTFVAGLRHDGMVAPCVIDDTINGEIILAYVDPVLAPALRPRDTVIIDNLSSHKIAGVRRAIEAAGAALLFLPPYSPDLNPIEMAFAKLESQLRAKALRAIDDLWRALGPLSNAFSPTECANYFRHAGYFQSA